MPRLILLGIDDKDVDILSHVRSLEPPPEMVVIHPDPEALVLRLGALAEIPVSIQSVDPLGDDVVLDGRYAFGRIGQTYAALIASNPLHYFEDSTDDLVQPGRHVFWVFEAGSESADGSFAAFIERVRNNPVDFEDGRLVYESAGRKLELQYQGDFRIDGEVQDLEYPRFDSPYVQAPRKPDVIRIEHDGESLLLDFYRMKRSE